MSQHNMPAYVLAKKLASLKTCSAPLEATANLDLDAAYNIAKPDWLIWLIDELAPNSARRIALEFARACETPLSKLLNDATEAYLDGEIDNDAFRIAIYAAIDAAKDATCDATCDAAWDAAWDVAWTAASYAAKALDIPVADLVKHHIPQSLVFELLN